MATYKVTNVSRMNIVGYVDWKANKNLEDLLKTLQKNGFIKNHLDFYAVAENYGLSFAIIERKRNSEFLFLSLHIEPSPELTQ